MPITTCMSHDQFSLHKLLYCKCMWEVQLWPVVSKFSTQCDSAKLILRKHATLTEVKSAVVVPSHPKYLHCLQCLQFSIESSNFKCFPELFTPLLFALTWVCSMLCTRVERWGGVELCVHWQRVATVDERTHDVVHIGLYLVPMFCVWCALLRICYGHDRIIDGRPTMSYSGNSTFSTFIYHSLPFFAILRLATPNIQLVVQLWHEIDIMRS